MLNVKYETRENRVTPNNTVLSVDDSYNNGTFHRVESLLASGKELRCIVNMVANLKSIRQDAYNIPVTYVGDDARFILANWDTIRSYANK